MRKDLNLEQMEREENAYTGLRPSAPEAHSPQARKEVEQIVVMVRLEMYNQGLPCGPKVLRGRLDEHEALKPLPSERTIARILARNGLTCGRTGWYEPRREESSQLGEGDQSDDMPPVKGGSS